MNLADLAKALDPECTIKEIGLRKGEKMHETLISKYEGTEYRSDTNDQWLTAKQLWRLIDENCSHNPSQTNFYKISP